MNEKNNNSEYSLPILSDSYKQSHWKMLENVDGISSYFESRSGAQFPTTVFFGLQYLLERYLAGAVITKDKIEEAKNLIKGHLGSEKQMNIAMWEHICNRHGGHLPITIKAIPEGTVVNESNALVVVENTDKQCAPLVNHLETLLTNVWSASTVATLSYYIKKDLTKWAQKTCDSFDHIPFQCHDFAMRSVKCPEAAGFTGMGHLVNFSGTDTVSSISFAHKYYGADYNVGLSIFATEHNTMMYLGREGEEYLVGKALQLNPSGIISIVADTFDIYNFVTNVIGKKYKQAILDRCKTPFDKFVVRPDSVTPDHSTKPEISLWIVQELWSIFGGTTNSKGYKVLHPSVSCIYGDSLDKDGVNEICDLLEKYGFASSNMVFGCGRNLLDAPHRDVQRFAYKSSAMRINGEWKGVFKDPLGSNKTSKKGLLKVIKLPTGEYQTLTQNCHAFETAKCELVEVFRDGEITKRYTFDEVRQNASTTM